jgi:hypothetical protein
MSRKEGAHTEISSSAFSAMDPTGQARAVICCADGKNGQIAMDYTGGARLLYINGNDGSARNAFLPAYTEVVNTDRIPERVMK